jgi:hypothetical protein
VVAAATQMNATTQQHDLRAHLVILRLRLSRRQRHA